MQGSERRTRVTTDIVASDTQEKISRMLQSSGDVGLAGRALCNKVWQVGDR